MRASTLFALLLVPATLSARDIQAPGLTAKWTTSDPPINLVHIDYGEINRHGEAVGYHHRPIGVDPPGARVLRIVQPPDASGVYRARVALRDPPTGAWIDKKAPSTFFPDAMSDDESSRRSSPLSRRAIGAAMASSSAPRGAALRSRDGTRTGASAPPTRCAALDAGSDHGSPASGGVFRRARATRQRPPRRDHGDLSAKRHSGRPRDRADAPRGDRGGRPQPGGVGNAFSITISPDGAVIRNAVVGGAVPERYSLAELRDALETWIAAIDSVRTGDV